MSKVLGIIGARLNSSRLPRKHLLDLAGQPVIARIFERLAQVPEFDCLVLATTDDAYNQPLIDWASGYGQAVFPFRGDVNDLVGRVDAVVETEQPDIVVYICGDSPLIEPRTISLLIQHQQSHPEADIVELATPPHGKFIHEGFSIYSRSTWQRIVAASQSADDKEHVGSALKRLRPTMCVHAIDDDPIFSRIEHRISVDTPSDYLFMAEVYRRWYATNLPESIVSLPWVIAELAQDLQLTAINQAVRQKAVGEHSVPILVVSQTGPGIGLGHLTRCLALAHALQDHHFAGVRLLIQGPSVNKSGLELIPHQFITTTDDLAEAIRREFALKPPHVVILDLHAEHLPLDLPAVLKDLGQQKVIRVGIDSLHHLKDELDLICLPGFHAPQSVLAACAPTPTRYGWPYYLIEGRGIRKSWQPGNQVIVLTGGSDTTGLGQTLPQQLDLALPVGTIVNWVRGPYAAAPIMPEQPRLAWQIHHAPQDLDHLITQANYALTIYGVSLFELLQQGIPSVVFSPYGERDNAEIPALIAANVAIVRPDSASALSALTDLMNAPDSARQLAARGPLHVDAQGPARLAKDIFTLLDQNR